MKSLVLYPYPVELDGISIQGEMLYRGLREIGVECAACNREANAEKELIYRTLKPDAVIGIGYWGDTPQLVTHPMQFGVNPVPWMNADGWISNYHDILNSLPLMMVTSNWVKEIYRRDGITNKNIEVMPIGIDTDAMRPMPGSDAVLKMREMLGIKPEEKVIFTAGGDTTSKGFQEVLKALGKINGKFKDWVYVGKSWQFKNPYYHYAAEMKIIKDFGLRKKIRFLEGPLSRDFMCCMLNVCDIYAGPSRIEGFGMVQVEAQACGKPVIGINSMGLKDTVIHNKTGFLARVGEEIKLTEEWVYKQHGFKKKHKIKFEEPKTLSMRANVDDVAEYLLKLLTDDELRKKMGENARKNAVENFDYRHVAGRVRDLIEKRIMN